MKLGTVDVEAMEKEEVGAQERNVFTRATRRLKSEAKAAFG